MLIQPDKNELGDKRLNEVEGLAQLREDNAKKTEAFKIPDQAVLENKAAALGMPMQPSELIRRIQKLNPKIIVEPGGVRNAVAVRVEKFDDTEKKFVKKYITGFYVDMPLPEYSCVVVDNRGLPFREIRGWRTILASLMRHKLLTKKQIKLQFGEAVGQRSELWKKKTQGEA